MEIAIAGAGIGGLAAALSLHAAGFRQVRVYEAARELREVGVGLNLPPHAVRELCELGLGPALQAHGVLTLALDYRDPQGQLIWTEPRGEPAGYRWPQYSIHRGTLQHMLVRAVRERLGEDAIVTGARITQVTNLPDGRVNFRAEGQAPLQADVFIAADGIRSAARDSLRGAVTPLASNGWTMYRGTAKADAFLGGHTMVITGDEHQRIVVYPIGQGLQNWLLVHQRQAGTQAELGNWNLTQDPVQLSQLVKDWRFDWLDIPALVAASPTAWEYPMADIDPLPQWTFGHCTLLGDAAHAMYPFGSNGASQAIIDGRVLAYALATKASVSDALHWYEEQRRSATAQVQLANRRQAGDVMARVSQLARQAAVADAAQELQQVEQKYKQLAGFDVDTLNQRPSWNVTPA
jgi:2-polyprenyl-6-methoxyphenol hydroxylase-like FAD-dependent oxidoreductase